MMLGQGGQLQSVVLLVVLNGKKFNLKFHFLVYIPRRIESKTMNRYLYMHVQSSTIHNKQMIEMFISGRMSKQYVTYTFNQIFSSVQFSHSVVSNSLWPHEQQHASLPVHHQLLEFTQTHAHWVGDAIQPFHPLSSPSPPALNLSQHQGLLKWVSSSHQVAKVLEFQLQSFQWTPRTDLL